MTVNDNPPGRIVHIIVPYHRMILVGDWQNAVGNGKKFRSQNSEGVPNTKLRSIMQ